MPSPSSFPPVPSVPRGVRVFSGVVVWGSPEKSNGIITGYQLRFTGSFNSHTVNKLASDSFHIVTSNDIRIIGTNIRVQVWNN